MDVIKQATTTRPAPAATGMRVRITVPKYMVDLGGELSVRPYPNRIEVYIRVGGRAPGV